MEIYLPESLRSLGVTVVIVLQVSGHTGFRWSLARNLLYIKLLLNHPRVFQEKRLRDRKTESEESLQKRLNAAKNEIEFSK